MKLAPIHSSPCEPPLECTDMSEILKRPGLKLIKEFPEGTKIVSMIVHKDRVYLATETQVWIKSVDSDEFHPLEAFS